MTTILTNELKPGIINLILNRPEKGNALNEEMIQAFMTTLQTLSKDDTIKVVILTGEGKHFCTGADLAWMQKMVEFSFEENVEDAKKLAQLYQDLNQFPKPIITVAKGACYGGALGLLACSDIVLASFDAKFCFSEVKLGLVPATIAPYVINAIGPRQARRYFLTAEVFGSSQAIEIGLAHLPLAEKSHLTQALEIAEQLLKNSPPAMTKSKQLIHNLTPISEKVQQMTAELIAEMRVSHDAQQRLRKFLS